MAICASRNQAVDRMSGCLESDDNSTWHRMWKSLVNEIQIKLRVRDTDRVYDFATLPGQRMSAFPTDLWDAIDTAVRRMHYNDERLWLPALPVLWAQLMRGRFALRLVSSPFTLNPQQAILLRPEDTQPHGGFEIRQTWRRRGNQVSPDMKTTVHLRIADPAYLTEYRTKPCHAKTCRREQQYGSVNGGHALCRACRCA